MKPDHFLDRLHHHEIVEAIHKAERTTTGQIRVYISHSAAPDPVAAAQRRFHKLKLHRHAQRNAILIFVAPKSQTFAIIGDQLIHEKAGDPAWQSLATKIADHLKSDQFTRAITFGIEQAAELLTTHFPKHVSPGA